MSKENLKRFINPGKGISLSLDGQVLEITILCLNGFITGGFQASVGRACGFVGNQLSAPHLTNLVGG